MNGEKKFSGVSGYTLKLIALSTMLIDHLAGGVWKRTYSVIASNSSSYNGDFCAFAYDHFHFLSIVYQVMRGIGRMAFPVFCFLLIEGFKHTSSKWKYARNLLLFALISEVPFDVTLWMSKPEIYHNNVLWTLLLGLLMMMSFKFATEKITLTSPAFFRKYLFYFLRVLACLAILLVFMALAQYVFRCDYGYGGIAAIAALYFLRDLPLWGYSGAVLLLTFTCGRSELYAMVMLIPIFYYNGSRGRITRSSKYFFYWFYPVHLFLIGVLCYYLGLPIYS